jgi:hypothetical protein
MTFNDHPIFWILLVAAGVIGVIGILVHLIIPAFVHKL